MRKIEVADINEEYQKLFTENFAFVKFPSGDDHFARRARRSTKLCLITAFLYLNQQLRFAQPLPDKFSQNYVQIDSFASCVRNRQYLSHFLIRQPQKRHNGFLAITVYSLILIISSLSSLSPSSSRNVLLPGGARCVTSPKVFK